MLRKLLFFSIVLLQSTEILAQAPENDKIQNAIELKVGNSPSENIYRTYFSSDEIPTDSSNDIDGYTIPNPSCGEYYFGDIWFKAKVPENGLLHIYLTTGTDWMTLYSGTPESLTQIDCQTVNTDVELWRTPGETIYIRLWEQRNLYKISKIVAYTLPVPSNNYVENAIELIPDGEKTFGTTQYSEYSAVWYKTTIPESGKLLFKTSPNHKISLYSGTIDNLNSISSENTHYVDTSIISYKVFAFDLQPGTTIYIRLWNYTFSNFSINVENFDFAENETAENAKETEWGQGYISQQLTEKTRNKSVWLKTKIPDSGDLGQNLIHINSRTAHLYDLFLYVGVPGNLNYLDRLGQGAEDYTYYFDKKYDNKDLYINIKYEFEDHILNSSAIFTFFTYPNNASYSNAIKLTIGNNKDEHLITQDYVSAIFNTPNPHDFVCYVHIKNYVWYKATVPNSGNLKIYSTASAKYYGDNGWICNGDLTNRTPGEVIDIAIPDALNQSSGSFEISAYDDSNLSNSNLETSDFNYYIDQNHSLIIETSNIIDNLAIYSITGQLLTVPINQTNTKADMSGLNSGIYLINITIGESSQTIKVAL